MSQSVGCWSEAIVRGFLLSSLSFSRRIRLNSSIWLNNIVWLVEQSHTWSKVSLSRLQRGQNQLLYRSGRRFLRCSTVGSSSIKSCNFWRFLCEFAKEVSNLASSPLRWLNVASQSTQEVRYLSLRCKLSHFSKPEFLETWVIKWRRCWVISNCCHLGVIAICCNAVVETTKGKAERCASFARKSTRSLEIFPEWALILWKVTVRLFARINSLIMDQITLFSSLKKDLTVEHS